MRSVSALATLVCLPSVSLGFVVPGSTGRSVASSSVLHMSLGDNDNINISRRNVIGRVLSFGSAVISAELIGPQPAAAKKPKEAITPENVKSAFDAIRYELEDPSGGIADLEGRISAKDWEGVMDFTKNYDGYFRKARVGRARKLLTDKKLKDDAVLMSNAITFDLIGINRASRPGQENQDEAIKYLGELKSDIRKILDLESTVDYSAVEDS